MFLFFGRWTEVGSQKQLQSFPQNISREWKNSCNMFVENLARMLHLFEHYTTGSRQSGRSFAS
jgi:hypothetical protein